MAKFYESNRQGYCPKCGKEIADWCDSAIDGDEAYYYFVCECGLAGCETFTLQYSVTTGDDATWDEIDNGWDLCMGA